MKRQLLLAIAALILPLSMMAQTYLYYEASDTKLWYLYEDGKDKDEKANQMIYVGASDYGTMGDEDFITSNEFLEDGSIRGNWRKLVLGDNSALWWERVRDDEKGLDQITEIKWAYGSVMTYAGVEYFPNLELLYIRSDGDKPRDNGGATLDLHQNTKLTALELKYISNTITGAESTSNGYFKYIDVSNTKLTTLNIPANSANYLETLKLENLSTLTTLNFNGSANFTKLLRLDISQTGITGPLDLSRLTALNRITIDASKTPQSGLTLPGSGWVRKHHDGDIETWVRASEAVHVEIWVDEEPSSDINLVEYVKMESLKIYGAATSIKMPNFLADDVKLKIDLTDCPNATIYWEGQESDIIKLTLINVASFNATSFTKLKVLRYLEPASANLTLSAANDKLKILDITRSGLTELDLYDDDGGTVIAPNLTTVKTWYAPLTLLDLSYHTSLLSAPYPTNKKMSPYHDDSDVYVDVDEDGDHYIYKLYEDGGVNEVDPDKWPGLNIVPTPKSQIDYFAEHAEHKTYENGITNVDDYNENYNNTLKTIKLVGCTGLTDVYLTHGFDAGAAATNADDAWVYYNSITDVDMTNCTNMTSFHCMNTLMTSLKLDGCTNLERVEIDQGKLTGLNGDISTTGCTNLKTLIAKRQKWESLDFFLSDEIRDKSEELAKIQQIQVNGGSYTLKTSDASRTKYVRHDPVTDTDMKYTCRLRHIDLSNLTCWDGDPSHNGLRKLLVDCNLLTELDLSVVGPGLQELQCTNNMLTTLDLTPLTESVKNGILILRNCNWKYQVGFENAEVVKGNWDGSKFTDVNSATSGNHDWVALHIEEGKGFSHYMDNDFGLYYNLHNARANQNRISHEANPWMCKVNEVNLIAATADDEDVSKRLPGASKFVDTTPCPTNHLGQHIFLHSQSEITSDPKFGAYKDQDLMNTVLTYKFDTGFLKKKVANEVSGKLDGVDDGQPDDYSLEKYEEGTGEGQFDYSNAANTYYDDPETSKDEGNNFRKASGTTPTVYTDYTKEELVGDEGLGHITVRMHLGSYLLNINPATLNDYSRDQDVDYYSSTIILDYDALIPDGVSVWCIEEEGNPENFEVHGMVTDGVIKMVQFGGDGSSNGPGGRPNKILPANTPVYVRAQNQPAGLYAFKPIRDKDLLGWENLRGENLETDYTLHGMESVNHGTVLDQNVADDYPVKLAVALEHAEGIKTSIDNILEGYNGVKHETTDINDPNFNIYSQTSKGVTRRSVLTLSIQNQKAGYPLIGFWPYNGTTLNAHRCYIPLTNLTSGGAKGFVFSFSKEVVGAVTGIKTVNEKVSNENVWYNMQGVRLNAQPTQHGVYIHNGKKVVVR